MFYGACEMCVDHVSLEKTKKKSKFTNHQQKYMLSTQEFVLLPQFRNLQLLRACRVAVEIYLSHLLANLY